MAVPRMRVALAASVVALGVPAAAAQAVPVDMVQQLDVAIRPARAGTRRRPRPASIEVTIQSPTTTPATTQRVRLFLARGVRFNTRAFPTCSPRLIARTDSVSRCPRGSIIGRGRARALGFIGGTVVPEDLTVTAVNSPRNTIQLFVFGETPVPVAEPIAGRLVRTRGRYAHRLDVTIPAGLREIFPGAFAPLVYFNVTVKAARTVRRGRGARARRTRVHFVETTACPRGGWPFEARFSFDPRAPFTDDPLTAEARPARCR